MLPRLTRLGLGIVLTAFSGLSAAEARAEGRMVEDEGWEEPLQVATDPEDEPEAEEELELAGAAEPPRYVEPSPDLGECLIFPDGSCELSPLVEFTLGGGQSSNDVDVHTVFRASAEVGLLILVTPDLQIGPTVELSVSSHEIVVDWEAGPRVRARWFVGGTHFVMEHGLGLEFQRYAYHDALASGTRVGAVADFGFGYRGIAGPFAQVSAVEDVAGDSDSDLRWIIGVRGNLIGWGSAFGGAVYGLSSIH